MVLDVSLLNTQHYKVRIKGKVEQSRERSSAFSYNRKVGQLTIINKRIKKTYFFVGFLFSNCVVIIFKSNFESICSSFIKNKHSVWMITFCLAFSDYKSSILKKTPKKRKCPFSNQSTLIDLKDSIYMYHSQIRLWVKRTSNVHKNRT